MGMLDIRREATFKLASEVEPAVLVQVVRERIAKLDPLEITEQPDGVEFEVGPSLFRIDMWCRPFNQLKGVSRGRVRLHASGSELAVRLELHLSRDGWVLSLALVAGMSAFTLFELGTALGFLMWGGLLGLAFLVNRVVVSARFGTLLERALGPHARPT